MIGCALFIPERHVSTLLWNNRSNDCDSCARKFASKTIKLSDLVENVIWHDEAQRKMCNLHMQGSCAENASNPRRYCPVRTALQKLSVVDVLTYCLLSTVPNLRQTSRPTSDTMVQLGLETVLSGAPSAVSKTKVLHPSR